MVPSVMPSFARSCAPIFICVVVAGCVASDLVSPRLLEIVITRNAFIMRNASALPPCSSKATSVPPPLIWLIASSRCAKLASVGYKARLIFGWPSRNCATFSALSLCAFTRSAIVSRPFRITQALKGESDGPVLRKKGWNTSSIHFFEPSTAPPSTRPWPSICLVAE